jgi:hypothetical protein
MLTAKALGKILKSPFFIPAIAIVMLFVGVGISSAFSGVSGVFGFLFPQTSANVSSTQTIVTGIQPLGQLVSMSVQVAKADIGVNIQQGAANACAFSASHVAQGAVEAGIDLTMMEPTDIQYNAETNHYTLTLPSPQLTSCRIDYIRQYNRSFTACNVDWDEARLMANYTAMNDFRDDAIEGGILTRAQKEAETVITGFIQALSPESTVEIHFREPNTSSFPASCQPAVPSGWTFDNQSQAWNKPS